MLVLYKKLDCFDDPNVLQWIITVFRKYSITITQQK